MTYFLKSNPQTDASIRVRTWTGDQFVLREIPIRAIEKVSDNNLPTSGLHPLVEAAIETGNGPLFVMESIDHLAEQLYPFLFNPPTMRRAAMIGQWPEQREKA